MPVAVKVPVLVTLPWACVAFAYTPEWLCDVSEYWLCAWLVSEYVEDSELNVAAYVL